MTISPAPANLLLAENLSVMGLYWGGYLSFAPHILTQGLQTLLGWYETGDLHPHVSHSLPFDQFRHGLQLLRDRKSTGKIGVTLP